MLSARLALALLTVAFIPAAHADVLIDCDDGQTSGDGLSRGFYIPSYPGTSMDAVYLYPSSTVAGERSFQLVAHAGSYDGEILGTSQVTVALPADPDGNVEAQFAFSSVEISPGSTVAFEFTLVSGAGPVVYATGSNTPSCPVIQTNGTTPPLDSFRRDGIRIQVHGAGEVAVRQSSWATVKTSFRD
jgi:hypothetical protein